MNWSPRPGEAERIRVQASELSETILLAKKAGPTFLFGT